MSIKNFLNAGWPWEEAAIDEWRPRLLTLLGGEGCGGGEGGGRRLPGAWL
jgi:hypothetical protein